MARSGGISASLSPTEAQVVNIRQFGAVGDGVANDRAAIMAAVDSIADSSATKPYALYAPPGVYLVGDATPGQAGIDLRGTSGLKDYISLIGDSPGLVTVRRDVTNNLLNPVVQMCNHDDLKGLTLMSAVSRLVHWDTGQSACRLLIEGCSMPQAGGNACVATGISGSGTLIVRNCDIAGQVSIHNGNPGDGGRGLMAVIGTAFTHYNGAPAVAIDMTGGVSPLLVHLAGLSGDFFDVDPSADILITSTTLTANPNLVLVCDNPAGLHFEHASADLKFWNWIMFPQMGRYVSTTAWAEGDVVALNPTAPGTYAVGTCGRVAVADSQWPAVVVNQLDNAGTLGWSPRLATGPYAEVVCDVGAVVIGDILVTSATLGQATVNNAQTDPTKILGYAISAKGAGAAGRVTVALAPAFRL